MPLRRLPPRVQGKRLGLKLRMSGQEVRRHILVLLRQDSAGGVEQGAAGTHIAAGVLQNRPLYGGQSTIYVPTANEKLRGRMRRLLSAEEM